jgi:cold shock protein
MKSEVQQGKIKIYHADKGFGFIGGTGEDIFFHISDFPADESEPKRNDRVKFQVVENQGKLKAVKIERVIDQSAKAKKSRVASHNKSITSALLSNFKK